jgi:hypothetical protein
MIDHARLQELAHEGAALMDGRTPLAGVVEPGCLVVESNRMARTFASLGITHAGVNLSADDLRIVEGELAKALIAGMAMMVAHYEPEIERLREQRGRVSMIPKLGDGRPRAV